MMVFSFDLKFYQLTIDLYYWLSQNRNPHFELAALLYVFIR